jgi:hypothetical protein
MTTRVGEVGDGASGKNMGDYINKPAPAPPTLFSPSPRPTQDWFAQHTSIDALGFNEEDMKSGKIGSLFPAFLMQ